MAASPQFKVYTADGEYIAACKYCEDAAAIVAKLDKKGTNVRLGHTKIIYVDKVDGDCSESYDAIATTLRNKHHII